MQLSIEYGIFWKGTKCLCHVIAFLEFNWLYLTSNWSIDIKVCDPSLNIP